MTNYVSKSLQNFVANGSMVLLKPGHIVFGRVCRFFFLVSFNTYIYMYIATLPVICLYILTLIRGMVPYLQGLGIGQLGTIFHSSWPTFDMD